MLKLDCLEEETRINLIGLGEVRNIRKICSPCKGWQWASSWRTGAVWDVTGSRSQTDWSPPQ